VGFDGWGFFSMLGRFACIAPAVVLVGLSSAHAADTTLTLAFAGTTWPICPPIGTLYGDIMRTLKERLERAHRADRHFAIVSVALMSA
jgi:hypothetical protein